MNRKALKAKLARKASHAIVGGMRPPDDPFVSWFGRVRVALPDEIWPKSGNGPMAPLFQLNVAELPHAPESLADIAVLTVFIDQEGPPPDGSVNGDGWLLRAYPTVDGLVEIGQPANCARAKPFAIRWEAIEADYPTWDDASSMDLPAEIEDDYADVFETADGTKVGGWPATIQSEIFWAPMNQHPAHAEFVFQIASEPKARWSWGDGGTGYFGRGTGGSRDVWTFAWQGY